MAATVTVASAPAIFVAVTKTVTGVIFFDKEKQIEMSMIGSESGSDRGCWLSREMKCRDYVSPRGWTEYLIFGRGST